MTTYLPEIMNHEGLLQSLYWTGPVIASRPVQVYHLLLYLDHFAPVDIVDRSSYSYWTNLIQLLQMDRSSWDNWTTGPVIAHVCYKWTGPVIASGLIWSNCYKWTSPDIAYGLGNKWTGPVIANGLGWANGYKWTSPVIASGLGRSSGYDWTGPLYQLVLNIKLWNSN